MTKNLNLLTWLVKIELNFNIYNLLKTTFYNFEKQKQKKQLKSDIEARTRINLPSLYKLCFCVPVYKYRCHSHTSKESRRSDFLRSNRALSFAYSRMLIDISYPLKQFSWAELFVNTIHCLTHLAQRCLKSFWSDLVMFMLLK